MRQLLAILTLLLLLTSSAHALTFVNDDNANAPLYYLPITLNNSQGSSIASGTEVCIGTASLGWGCGAGFNPALYTQYVNFRASNVNFQDGAGNLLTSWNETPGANSNAPILWWVKTNASIPSNGSLTIYMVFVATGSSSMSTTHTGAAPLYDATYAHYDNGASVFRSQYNDFAGTSTPAGWTLTQSTPPTIYISNGAWMWSQGNYNTTGATTANGFLCSNTGLTTATTPTIQSVIGEWFGGGVASEAQIPSFFGTNGTADCANGNLSFAGWNFSHSGVVTTVGSTDGGQGLSLGQDYASAQTPYSQLVGLQYPLFVGSTYTTNPTTASATSISYNYQQPDTPVGPSSSSSMTLAFTEKNELGFAAITPFAFYWTRWRSYPPNGVEPTATYGQLSTVSSGVPPSAPSMGLLVTGKTFIRSSVINPTSAVVRLLGQSDNQPYGTGGDFQSVTFTPVAGDTVVVVFTYQNQGCPSPAITLSAPYVSGYTWNAGTCTGVPGGTLMQMFYANNVPGGPATFTSNNLLPTSQSVLYSILDVSNLKGTVDQTQATSGSGSATATTTSANEVAIAASTTTNFTGAKSPTAGFTAFPRQTFSSGPVGYTMQLFISYSASTGPAGSVTGGFTSSAGSANALMMTFPTSQPLTTLYGGVTIQ